MGVVCVKINMHNTSIHVTFIEQTMPMFIHNMASCKAQYVIIHAQHVLINMYLQYPIMHAQYTIVQAQHTNMHANMTHARTTCQHVYTITAITEIDLRSLP